MHPCNAVASIAGIDTTYRGDWGWTIKVQLFVIVVESVYMVIINSY